MTLPATLVDEHTFNLIFSTLDSLPFLKENPPIGNIVELGSFLGGSIVRIANYLKGRNRLDNYKIYAIDNWKCDNISPAARDWAKAYDNFLVKCQENIERAGHLDKIITLPKDAIFAAGCFKDESIDFLFVDDDHTYPNCRDTLQAWLPKVKVKGFIVGHDYGDAQGIQNAVAEILGDRISLAVTRSSYLWQKLESVK